MSCTLKTALAATFGFAATALNAQTAVLDSDLTNTADDTYPTVGEWEESYAPYLFEDEVDDVGPQYLLTEKGKRPVFRFLGDFQSYFTSNANLAGGNAKNSSITVGTLQVEFLPYQTALWEGTLGTRFGLRFQWYRYGIYGTREKTIVPGIQMQDNDFDSIRPYAEANYRIGDWYAALGFEYTQLDNTVADAVFYKESVPYWVAGYTVEIAPESALYLQYDGRYRFTKSKPGVVPSPFVGDLNNRTDQAFSLVFSQILIEDLLLQAAYRFQWTLYTGGDAFNGNQNRQDIYNTVSASATYFIWDEVSVRLFVNWQARNTNKSAISNYQVFNGGGGINVNARF